MTSRDRIILKAERALDGMYLLKDNAPNFELSKLAASIIGDYPEGAFISENIICDGCMYSYKLVIRKH